MRRTRNRLLKIFVILALAGIIIFAPFTVPSTSMLPTVASGDLVLVNKFRYGVTSQNLLPLFGNYLPYRKLISFGLPARGEAVVFNFPGYRDEVKHDDDEAYMKRCVAIAGDTLQIVNDSVYVNKRRSPSDSIAVYTLSERTMKMSNERSRYTTFPKGMGWTISNYGPLRIPKSGDTLKLDAQTWRGWSVFIEREGHAVDAQEGTIDGTKTNAYVVERNYIFCLGDNRHVSLDSRFSGLIADDNIYGSPVGVLLSTGDQSYPRLIR